MLRVLVFPVFFPLYRVQISVGVLMSPVRCSFPLLRFNLPFLGFARFGISSAVFLCFPLGMSILPLLCCGSSRTCFPSFPVLIRFPWPCFQFSIPMAMFLCDLIFHGRTRWWHLANDAVRVVRPASNESLIYFSRAKRSGIRF